MTRDDARRRTVLIALGLYAIMLLFVSVMLDFDMMRSDALTYWKESFKWRTPFSTWWVPGHPLMLAVLRGITFGLVPGIVLMISIALASYVLSVAAVHRLAQAVRAPWPGLFALAFACFPFVGLTYSVYPIADSPSTALYVLAVLALVRERWVPFIAFSAAALMVHKVMWFFVPPLLAYAFFNYPAQRGRLWLAVVPLGLWVASGAIYHNDVLWFVRWGIDHLVAPRGDIPFLDGLIEPLRSGSWPKVAKGIAVVSLLAATVTLSVSAWRREQWLAICIAGALLILILTINSYEIWVTVRFGKLLLLPLALVLGSGAARSEPEAIPAATDPVLPAWGWVAMVACFASNLAYGWYMATVFYK